MRVRMAPLRSGEGGERSDMRVSRFVERDREKRVGEEKR